MRVLSWLMAAVFGLAVGVQMNDPDPLMWVVLYGWSVGLSVAAALGRDVRRAALPALLVYGAGVLYTLPAMLSAHLSAYTSFKMRSTGDEIARECVGLLLCAVWAAVLWRRAPTTE